MAEETVELVQDKRMHSLSPPKSGRSIRYLINCLTILLKNSVRIN